MELKFSATILQNENMDAAYVEVPYDIKELFGKGRLLVNAAFDGIPYQGQVVKMGAASYIIGITRQIRRQIGKSFGDIVEVVIQERGVYRIHQFEKQEMIVVCKPEESPMWFEKLWQNTVDLFRSMDIPVRTIECCSGDLADLKVKSYDVEAWSPRQKKYFEVGSCSNLGDAQARRLKIRVNGKDGKYFAHTLNNTVVAPPRMLIAFLENNLNADGTVNIPEVLRPYMGGKDKIGG